MAATMDTITLPHLPQYRLFVALYPDVGNVEFLRKQLLDGNTDFEYAFLDASMVRRFSARQSCLEFEILTFVFRQS